MTSNARARTLRVPLAILVSAGCAKDASPVEDGSSTGGSTSADAEAEADSSDGSSGAQDSGSSEGGESTGSTGGSPAECDPETLAEMALAPPPVMDPQFFAIPIDITSLEAAIVFDVAAGEARAEATLAFAVGEDGGNPVFDLRQSIDEATFNGEPLADPAAQMPYVDLGGLPGSHMRVMQPVVEACTRHVMQLRYAIGAPEVGQARPPAYDGQGLHWSLDASDVTPGHFLEQWVPANLIHDRHPTTLDLEIANAPGPHVVVTNGTVEELGENHWRIAFPDHFSADSPMLFVEPAAAVESYTFTATLPSRTIELQVTGPADADVDLVAVSQTVTAAMVDAEETTGPYAHGPVFPVFAVPVAAGAQGMEYEGAVYTDADPIVIAHETYHSWFARGIHPAQQPDGWWDEAWTTYAIDGPPSISPAWDPEDPPIDLVYDSGWTREMVGGSHVDGARLFGSLVRELGEDAVVEAMSKLYTEHVGERLTTEDVESFLRCSLDDAVVGLYFHRFVYGLEGEADPSPADACN